MSKKTKQTTKPYLSTVLKVITIIGLICLTIFLIINQPTNTRNWEVGMEKLVDINIHHDQLTIKNLRDYHYDQSGITSFGYIDRQIDLTKVTQVWLVVEPFTQFKQVAHTYFIFDIEGQDSIAISVEARREKGEKYSTLLGAMNKYELIYIWSTETDQTIRRVILEHNKLYMYPLTISQTSTQKLFLQLARTTQQLVNQPRFYNTFTSNCTNELAKVANQVKPDSIPWNIAYIFPGYTANELYHRGFIPNDLPLEDITNRYAIHPIIPQIYQQPNFSELLRQYLSN